MMVGKDFINGIQQVGIGVPNVQEIWTWYRRAFGLDLRIFEEAADAPLMTKYTGDEVHSRTATLAMSLDGGGGFEIWQFTSRPTVKPSFNIQFGDLGLTVCKIKSRNVEKTYAYLKSVGIQPLGEPMEDSLGRLSFFVQDPNGNLFQVVEGRSWFGKSNHPSNAGGVSGMVIGVSDMNKSIPLYREVLGYDVVEMDEINSFEDFNVLPGGSGRFRRIRLTHASVRKGAFSELLGVTEIELVQSLDRTDVKRIFENRFWGDWGFIHLCFDVQRMDQFQRLCESKGFPFTVDSANSFQMGAASGRFSYIEDPDGTWLEFVETHKVPIIKKMGWYVRLTPSRQGKPLPKWMLKSLRFNRVKD